jgi:hypothetical protein
MLCLSVLDITPIQLLLLAEFSDSTLRLKVGGYIRQYRKATPNAPGARIGDFDIPLKKDFVFGVPCLYIHRHIVLILLRSQVIRDLRC